MAVFQITANDTDMGEYTADSAAEALDAYARDAGYSDYSEVVAQFGDDAVAVEIDTDAICAAVEQSTGKTVFQDGYGAGVALVDGVSYATYNDLAALAGKSAAHFSA